jgi:hypothetical protein
VTRLGTARKPKVVGVGLLVGALATAWAEAAQAGSDDALLLPTLVRPADRTEVPRRPDAGSDPRVARWARQLDWILGEAAQDLGLTLDVTARPHGFSEELSEAQLVAHARDSWVISPRLTFVGSKIRVRIVAVAPGTEILMVRVRDLELRELEVGAMVMMRDLIVAGHGSATQPSDVGAMPPGDDEPAVTPARSEGRAVLALNGAILGGYVGFSLQRASGSDDARLLYPLIALGTGVGLGASMIAASEWDVGIGDAWYLSAGAWWPAASGLLLARAYDVQPVEDRFVYGLVGASAGMTLATVALSLEPMSEGGATLTHSGGAWGTVLGGLVELYAQGRTDEPPVRGMGYGAGIGVLTAGVLATQVDVKPSRVLLVNLMAALGGLTGAAVASPFVFGEERTESENRAWLASMAGGTVLGAAIGFSLTAPAAVPGDTAALWAALPYAGVVAPSPSPNGSPALGGGLRGAW